MTRLIVMRKGGGGKVAVNPALVSHVRSAAGAYTDIFFDGHQIAVEGSFEEVVARLGAPEKRAAEAGESEQRANGGLVIGRLDR
jgi:hypothetical protein